MRPMPLDTLLHTVRRALALGALATLTLALPAPAAAGGHREAPGIAHDPAADTLDLFAWVTPGTHDHLTVILTVAPQPGGPAASGPEPAGLASDVRYTLHLADVSRAGLPDLALYAVECRSTAPAAGNPADPAPPVVSGAARNRALTGVRQHCRVVREVADRREVLADAVPVVPPDLGPRANAAAYGTAEFDAAFVTGFIHPLGLGGADGRVFLGPRDDPYFADRGALTDLLNLRITPGAARDAFAGADVYAIALELPTAALPPADGRTLGVWGATSRRKMQVRRPDGGVEAYGPWVQVSRTGLPLINDLVIGHQDKDRFNARPPGEDAALFEAYFRHPVLVREAAAAGLYERLGVSAAQVEGLARDRTDILAALSLMTPDEAAAAPHLLGDVLRVRLDEDSAFPNGRRVGGGPTPARAQTDVTDALLTLILTGGAFSLGDGVDANDRPFLEDFPYLAPPRSGFTGE